MIPRVPSTTRRIYIDIDDVLCETAASLCDLAAREFGRHVPYAHVHQFDLQKVFEFSDDEMRRFMELSHHPDVLAAFPETPDAVRGVHALRAAGFTVEIVTGRPASAHIATEKWLDAVGLGDSAVTYVDKYGRDRLYPHHPGDPRTITLPELLDRHYDFAIDDSPVVLAHLATAWPTTHILVFDRPWNASLSLASNMERVPGWAKILQTLT